MAFPNTGPGEGPSPKKSWHSTLASFRFRVKGVVSPRAHQAPPLDDVRARRLTVVRRLLTRRNANSRVDNRATVQPRSALANVTRGEPPELERRSSGRHNWVLRGELEQGLLVVRLDNREAVRILVGKDRPEHDHVATLEVGAPMSSVAAHDLAL